MKGKDRWISVVVDTRHARSEQVCDGGRLRRDTWAGRKGSPRLGAEWRGGSAAFVSHALARVTKTRALMIFVTRMSECGRSCEWGRRLRLSRDAIIFPRSRVRGPAVIAPSRDLLPLLCPAQETLAHTFEFLTHVS